MSNETHTLFGSINIQVPSDWDEISEASNTRSTSVKIRDAIKNARDFLRKHYPQFKDIPQLSSAAWGPGSFRLEGSRDEIEEAALTLSSIADVETRNRLYDITTHETGNGSVDYNNQASYVNDVIISEAA